MSSKVIIAKIQKPRPIPANAINANQPVKPNNLKMGSGPESDWFFKTVTDNTSLKEICSFTAIQILINELETLNETPDREPEFSSKT